jgi:hypothetical protein
MERVTHLFTARYGWVAIGTYLGIYVSTLGTVYVLFDSHLLNVKDIIHDLSESSIASFPFVQVILDKLKENATAGTFILAWLTTKLTEPARLVITILVTPKISKLFSRLPK